MTLVTRLATYTYNCVCARSSTTQQSRAIYIHNHHCNQKPMSAESKLVYRSNLSYTALPSSLEPAIMNSSIQGRNRHSQPPKHQADRLRSAAGNQAGSSDRQVVWQVGICMHVQDGITRALCCYSQQTASATHTTEHALAWTRLTCFDYWVAVLKVRPKHPHVDGPEPWQACKPC